MLEGNYTDSTADYKICVNAALEKEIKRVKRYFKEAPPEVGIFYYEYDGEYNVRRIEIRNDQWDYASENYRRDYLADQPLSASEVHREPWEYEITAEEFEQAWNEAIKRSPSKADG